MRIDCAIKGGVKDVFRAVGDKIFIDLNFCSTMGTETTKAEITNVVRCRMNG